MSTDDAITAWGNHVDGAVALTKMRGTEQFNDPMSHQVFRAVRTMMVSRTGKCTEQCKLTIFQITSCVQRAKPVDSFPGLNGWIANDFNEENAANRLTLICIDLPAVRARGEALLHTTYDSSKESEVMQILEMAQTVDDKLQHWYQTLPVEWHHHTIGIVNGPLEDPATADRWPGEQHVYHDVPLASIVNDYRVCRIFCQRVILGCITWLRPNPSLDLRVAYKHAIFTIQRMVDEISACVPFHMSYDLQPTAKRLGQEKQGELLPGPVPFPLEHLGDGLMDYTRYSRRSFRWLQSRLAIVRRGQCRDSTAIAERVAGGKVDADWGDVWTE
jgi:hypothetical protein